MCSFSTRQRSIENNIDTIGSLIVSKQRLIENDIDTIDNLTVSKQRLASMIWINLCSAGYWQTLFPWTKIEINTDTIDCVRTANYIVANNIVVILWFGWWLTTRLMIPRALQRTKRHRIPWQNSKIFLTLFSTETDAGAWFSTHLCRYTKFPINTSPRSVSGNFPLWKIGYSVMEFLFFIACPTRFSNCSKKIVCRSEQNGFLGGGKQISNICNNTAVF
jgi:hypothetical protein